MNPGMTPEDSMAQVAGFEMAGDYVERTVLFVVALCCLIGLWALIGIGHLILALKRRTKS